jgi:hypothetical protein
MSKTHVELMVTFELIDLDAGILTNLRSHFENDLSLDEGFSVVEKIAVDKAWQAITAFDHSVVKREPATWASEVSSTKIEIEKK